MTAKTANGDVRLGEVARGAVVAETAAGTVEVVSATASRPGWTSTRGSATCKRSGGFRTSRTGRGPVDVRAAPPTATSPSAVPSRTPPERGRHDHDDRSAGPSLPSSRRCADCSWHGDREPRPPYRRLVRPPRARRIPLGDEAVPPTGLIGSRLVRTSERPNGPPSCPGTLGVRICNSGGSGGVAEWLGKGLQNPLHRFNSGPRLARRYHAQHRALSSGVERFLDAEEVRGSNPLAPTTKAQVRGHMASTPLEPPPQKGHNESSRPWEVELAEIKWERDRVPGVYKREGARGRMLFRHSFATPLASR